LVCFEEGRGGSKVLKRAFSGRKEVNGISKTWRRKIQGKMRFYQKLAEFSPTLSKDF
jgi:hypothetical protein